MKTDYKNNGTGTQKQTTETVINLQENKALEAAETKVSFSAADLWNIQRMKRAVKVYRRAAYFL